MDDRAAAVTGFRGTPRGAPKTPGCTFARNPECNPVRGKDVPGDGDCLYHAFGVLLGTYGVPDATGTPQRIHLTARGLRDRLCTHVAQWSVWTRHFLRIVQDVNCLLYTSPSPRDRTRSRMPSSA